jgi:hypothetical protein
VNGSQCDQCRKFEPALPLPDGWFLLFQHREDPEESELAILIQHVSGGRSEADMKVTFCSAECLVTWATAKLLINRALGDGRPG